MFALAAAEHVPLRVEEFVSQLPVCQATSGRKLSRAPIEHVPPSVISQDGSPWRLIHLFSPAPGSTTAEGRRNTAEFPHHKPTRCFLRGTMLIKLTVLPLILGNGINKKSWVLGVTTLKYLPLHTKRPLGSQRDLHIKEEGAPWMKRDEEWREEGEAGVIRVSVGSGFAPNLSWNESLCM